MGDAGVAVSRGGGNGLMPGADVLDLLAAGKGVQHADDGVAAQSEQRREFVAEDGAHHDGAGRIGYRDSQSLRHADQGNAHGSHGSP